MIAGLVLALLAASQDTAGVGAAMQSALAAPAHAMRWPDLGDVRPALEAAYTARAWAPLWSVNGVPTIAAHGAIATLDSAARVGLDPADYDAGSLAAESAHPAARGVAGIAEFDVTLSAAVARYAWARTRGRIDPRLLHPTLPPPRSIDLATLLDHASQLADPDSLFRNLEPQHLTYQRLIALLARYRAIAASNPGADSAAARIRQIGVSLERWRWLPPSVDGPWIVVNVPAFRLYAFNDGDEAGTIQMNVVVGQAVAHATPLLTTRVTAVQFRPAWMVPAKIALNELRPQALRDRRFLARHHYELLRGDSVVEPTPANIRRIGFGVDIRQAPGPWNALGQVKFVTPNGADIYLHDTPERLDFLRAERDFSHGCIRVAAPRTLVDFAMQDEPGWSPERLAEAWKTDSTLTVPLTRAIPVLVMYQTIMPGESGAAIVYPDLYHLDAALDSVLSRGYPYPAYHAP